MVGALARFTPNYNKPSPMAKQAAALFNLKPVCHNPFMNSIAQLVEVVHNVEDSIRLIDEIEATGLQSQPDYHKPDIKVKAGDGGGRGEGPPGTLFPTH